MGEDDNTAVRVLIIEDHAVLAGALAAALDDNGFAVTVAPTDQLDPASVLELADATVPTVVVVDLYLGPELLGIPLIGPLRDRDVNVVVLTASHDPVMLGACVVAGAAAVVDKSEPLEQLVQVLTAAADGRPTMTDSERAILLEAHERAMAERAGTADRFGRLSRREAEVLGQLIDGAAAKEVAHRLGVSVPTVRTQIRSVLDKLGVRSQRDAVVEAVRAGWRPPER